MGAAGSLPKGVAKANTLGTRVPGDQVATVVVTVHREMVIHSSSSSGCKGGFLSEYDVPLRGAVDLKSREVSHFEKVDTQRRATTMYVVTKLLKTKYKASHQATTSPRMQPVK